MQDASRIVLALALAMAVPAAAIAQAPSPTGGTAPAADPADVESLDAIIGALYDVISGPPEEARNWDRFRSLFLPEARLIPTFHPQGVQQVQARLMTVDDYIANTTPLFEQRGFFEDEIGRVTERFENIAHVFSTYESRWTPEDENPFQRGINSIQLVWDGSRWWIANIMWWGVSPDAEIPEKYWER